MAAEEAHAADVMTAVYNHIPMSHPSLAPPSPPTEAHAADVMTADEARLLGALQSV